MTTLIRLVSGVKGFEKVQLMYIHVIFVPKWVSGQEMGCLSEKRDKLGGLYPTGKSNKLGLQNLFRHTFLFLS